MEILKQIEAKDKAMRVIESCQTEEQLDVACKYVRLYWEKFEDMLGQSTLNNVIEEKRKGL